jgi:hypothetical protein
MTAPLLPRADRSTAVRVPTAADDDLTAQQQAQLAAQHAAFDYEAAETAEMLREHQALEALMQENLKNEDEIMKKWIALI